MNALSAFAGLQVWHIAGWTMLHFLWLGTAVAAMAIVVRLLLRRAAPNVRYTVALGCLALLAALPLGIATWLTISQPFHNPPLAVGESTGKGDLQDKVDARTHAAPQPTVPSAPGSAGGFATDERPWRGEPFEYVAPLNPRQSRGLFAFRNTLESCVSYLPWLWIIGTPITFALLATGIIGTKRLRRASRTIIDGPIVERLASLASSLRITQRVGIAVCERIASPVLIGIVRPIILLPPAALSGWSPDEIEMVLLHELAHVRRWDNLVNLMQRLIESLLFFHPAVWLVSTWVRRERESCCDAFVVRRTERPHAYAELLVALAAQMPRSVLFHPAASSAMSAGPLKSRIRRILELEDDPMLISGKSLTLTFAAVLTTATLAMLYLPTIGQAEESTTEVTEATENNAEEDPSPEPPHAAPANAIPRVLATFTHDSFAQNSAFPDAYRKALKNNQYVDLVYRENDVALVVAGPEPNEKNWPDVLGETPRKDRVIAEKAYVRLGLKLAPLTNAETVYRQMTGKPLGVQIVGGSVPKGLPLPSLLTRINHEAVKSMDSMLLWLESEKAKSADTLKIYATADDKEYLFGAAAGQQAPATRTVPAPPVPPRANNAEVKLLRQYVQTLQEQFDRIDAMYRDGTRGGSLDKREVAAYELALAQGELASAEGNREQALKKYNDALTHAGEAVKAVTAAYEVSLVDYGAVLDANKNLLNIQRKLIHIKDEAAEPESADTQPPATTFQSSPGPTPLHDLDRGLKFLFFHSPTSQPSKEMQPIAEKVAKQFPAAQFQLVDVSQNPDLARKYDVDAIPTCLMVRNGNVIARLVGLLPEEMIRKTVKASVESVVGQTPPSPIDPQSDLPHYVTPAPEIEAAAAPKHRSRNRRAAAPTGAAPPKTALRYQDQTFEQWRDTWQTELSNVRRREAVNALGAFGRAGYEKEAAETILDVAGNYDFEVIDSGSEGDLKKAVLDELAPQHRSHTMAAHWVPSLAARLEKDPAKWRSLANHLLHRLRTTDQATIAILQSLVQREPAEVRSAALTALVRTGLSRDGQLTIDDKTRELLAIALQSEDSGMILTAMQLLLDRSADMQRPQLVFLPQLVPILFHADEKIQRQARGALQHIQEKDAKPVVEDLIAVLQNDARKTDHLAAIRALAAMSEKAAAAEPALQQLVKSTQATDLLIATPVALDRLRSGQQGGHQFGDTFFDGLSEEQKNALGETVGQRGSQEFMQRYMSENSKILPRPNE
jgi:beta-lactamase regulating signal transducer with metallopeptidase domain